ncbi:hypothetical protein GYB22_12615 [bacterium]|nr:hypothetical protein [bacterium]
MKQNKNIVLLALGLFVFPLILWNCNVTYYHPTNSVIPYVEEEGDIQIEPNYGFSEEFNQIGLQGAYMLDSLKLVTGNFKFSPDNFAPKTDPYIRRSSMIEAGYGLRHDFTNAFNYCPVFRVGVGSIYGTHREAWKSLKFIRSSIQNTLSFRSRWLDIGFAAQLGAINFLDIKDNGGAIAQGTVYERDLEDLKQKPFAFYYEISPYIRIGYGDLKFMAQLSAMGINGGQEKVKYDEVYLNFGLSFIINKNRVN